MPKLISTAALNSTGRDKPVWRKWAKSVVLLLIIEVNKNVTWLYKL
jgi:hypothetical protein